jgi:hypothetical protein
MASERSIRFRGSCFVGLGSWKLERLQPSALMGETMEGQFRKTQLLAAERIVKALAGADTAESLYGLCVLCQFIDEYESHASDCPKQLAREYVKEYL